MLTHDQGSHSTSQPSSAMKMDLDHCMKTMKIQICPKNMKTEISGQNFPKIFACGGQNSKKFSPAASETVNIFRAQNMKF